MSEVKEKLSNNLSEENKTSKYVDIFLHLKLNMQNNAINCKCENDDKYYCIPCKATCCSFCNFKLHEPHILVRMKDNKLDKNKLEQIFNDFSKNTKKSKLISDSASLKKEIISRIDTFADEMIEKLNKYRKIKKDEIEQLFKNLEKNKEAMNNSVKKINQNLSEFVKRNKKFFNLNQPGVNNEDANNDINNTYFLLGYDILSLTNQGINQLYKDIDIMGEDLQNYIDNQEEDFTRIRRELDKLLADNQMNFQNKNGSGEKKEKSPKNNNSS